MWLGQQLHPAAPLYNMVETYTIAGPLDAGAFAAAFDAVVAAADALRTVIVVEAGVPYGRVLPSAGGQLEHVDLADAPDPDAAYATWRAARVRRLLPLDRMLWDAALVRLGPTRHVWYLNQHHLITDGWSCSVVYAAVAAAYAAQVAGTGDGVPPLGAFAAYAAHARALRGDAPPAAPAPAVARAAAYWEAKAAEPLPPPVFYGRSLHAAPGDGARTHRVVCELGAARTAAIKELAAREEIATLSPDMTIFNIFAALLGIYLQRISGEARHRIGVPFHGRSQAAHRQTVGLFIEIGPLLLGPPAEATFLEAIAAAGVESMRGLQHAKPGISSAALNRSYAVLLNFVNTVFAPFHGLPTHVDWVHTGYGDSGHALRLQVHDFDGTGAYTLLFDFNAELFPPQLQRRAVAHFLAVVDACLSDPTGCVGAFPLLTAEEHAELVGDFNATDVALPPGTVLDWFAAQVRRTPDAEAVRAGTAALSYAELDARATMLAEALAAAGAGPGTLAGICLEHSLDMVAGVLGVLKCGAAYVPLDPTHPPARLAYMLADAAAPVLLTQGSLLPLFTPADGAAGGAGASPPPTIICADRLPPAAGAPAPSRRAPGPGDLAYVIYTSGSTGQPKGTLVEHGSITCAGARWISPSSPPLRST
jgi:hypothetical protein